MLVYRNVLQNNKPRFTRHSDIVLNKLYLTTMTKYLDN